MNLKSDLRSDAKADFFLKLSSWALKTIGFHLGTNFPGKCWPLENFVALGKRLMKKLNLELLIMGDWGDRFLIETCCSKLGKKARPVIGSLSFAISMIKRLDVFCDP